MRGRGSSARSITAAILPVGLGGGRLAEDGRLSKNDLEDVTRQRERLLDAERGGAVR